MAPADDLSLARLRSLARVVRAFVHDVRGAAGAIGLHTELMEGNLASVDDSASVERQRRYLAVVRQEQERIVELVEGFAGLMTVGRGPDAAFDLAAAVREIGAVLRALAKQRTVCLEVVAPPHPVCVTAAREEVRQRVLDLGLAAVEGAPAQSTVTLVLRETPGWATVGARAEPPSPGAGARNELRVARSLETSCA
jgi:signal transduction histidine kinase